MIAGVRISFFPFRLQAGALDQKSGNKLVHKQPNRDTRQGTNWDTKAVQMGPTCRSKANPLSVFKFVRSMTYTPNIEKFEVVPIAGIEPATFGLQNRCSTS
jgi:hypothetical protein